MDMRHQQEIVMNEVKDQRSNDFLMNGFLSKDYITAIFLQLVVAQVLTQKNYRGGMTSGWENEKPSTIEAGNLVGTTGPLRIIPVGRISSDCTSPRTMLPQTSSPDMLKDLAGRDGSIETDLT
jgi:hypothetical protein